MYFGVGVVNTECNFCWQARGSFEGMLTIPMPNCNFLNLPLRLSAKVTFVAAHSYAKWQFSGLNRILLGTCQQKRVPTITACKNNIFDDRRDEKNSFKPNYSDLVWEWRT
jgi:hypothetical protein